MEYARLGIATLKDVTVEYYYGCSCQSCLHTAHLSLSKLRTHVGDDFPCSKLANASNLNLLPDRRLRAAKASGFGVEGPRLPSAAIA
jgi:hypothetical protein